MLTAITKAMTAGFHFGDLAMLHQLGYIRVDFDMQFDFNHKIAQGSFARVHKVQNKRGDVIEEIIAKVVHSDVTGDKVAFEASYLAAAQSHPNIVKLMALSPTIQGWALLLESCCGGDLQQFVSAHGHLCEQVGLNIAGKCIFSALGHIHTLGILHRDMKPENLLIDNATDAMVPSRIVLTDFGIACHVAEHEKMSVPCGSPGCVAPEVMINGRFQSTQSDIFGGAVALYFGLGGIMPFRGPDVRETLRQNMKANVTFDADSFEGISTETKATLTLLLHRRPRIRPTAVQAASLLSSRVEELSAMHGTGTVLAARLFPVAPQMPRLARRRLRGNFGLRGVAKVATEASPQAPETSLA